MVVEGRTEGAAFRHLPRFLAGCPPIDRPAVVEGIGADAPAAQIAKRVVREVAFLQRDNRKVIVCVDRESRSLTAANFAADVARALEAALPGVGGRAGYPVDVVVADRAFEAWLLADIDCLWRAAKPPKRCFEGYMRPMQGRKRGHHYGDDQLEKFIGRYEKVRDGPRLFEQVNFAHARVPCGDGGRGSQSLAAFLQALGA